MEDRDLRAYVTSGTWRPTRGQAMSSVPLLEVPRRSRIVSSCLVILGAGVAIYGLRSAPDRTWPNLLLGGFYVTSLALSAMFFFATQRLTGARWSANLRRIPEAFALALQIGERRVGKECRSRWSPYH